MERRNFLTASLAAGTAAVVASKVSAKPGKQYYYELIRFKLLNNSKKKSFSNYWKKAAIPALNRLGIEPIGVFQPKYGSEGGDRYVLLPHKNIESFLSAWDKVASDTKYLEKAKAFIETEMADPLYFRYETTLLRAFTHLPGPQIPAHIKKKRSRLFEVRIYESHSRHKAKLKMEMFNQGGEIEIFKKTGLNPVIFGETLAGPKMPNLIYILGFESMEDRDKRWKSFTSSDGWKKLKKDPRYKKSVSAITDLILTPLSCSQI